MRVGLCIHKLDTFEIARMLLRKLKYTLRVDLRILEWNGAKRSCIHLKYLKYSCKWCMDT